MKYLAITIVSATVLSFGANAADCLHASVPTPEATERLWREEAMAIRALPENRAAQVFFLSVFKGLMPVPRRFVPLARAPNEWNSLGLALSCMGIESIDTAGFIRIGKRADLDTDQFERIGIDRKGERLTRFGLNIVVIHLEPKATAVTIYDKVEFVAIFDSSPYLWEAMLDSWNELGRQSSLK